MMTIQKAIEQQTIEAERATTRHIELVQAIRNTNQAIADFRQMIIDVIDVIDSDLRQELAEAGVLEAKVRELE